MITADTLGFLNLLIARGGVTRIPAEGPASKYQTLADQELCTVVLDEQPGYELVSISEKGIDAWLACAKVRRQAAYPSSVKAIKENEHGVPDEYHGR